MRVGGQRDFTEDSRSPNNPGKKNNINTGVGVGRMLWTWGLAQEAQQVLTECSSAEWRGITKANSSSEPVRRLLSIEEDSRRH